MQNLVRHLKFVAKEAHEVAYDDQKMLSSQSSKSELERYALHVVFLPSKGSNTHSSDQLALWVLYIMYIHPQIAFKHGWAQCI